MENRKKILYTVLILIVCSACCTNWFSFEEPKEMKLTIQEKNWKRHKEKEYKCKIEIHKGFIYQGNRDVRNEKGSLKLTFNHEIDTTINGFDEFTDSTTLIIGKSFLKSVEYPEDYKYFTIWFKTPLFLERKIYDIDKDCLKRIKS